ncbi:MAG: glycosyltransferase family 2 protein [Chitinispirillales bacterium]|nr:glycosyltransferase family 2 protein [Chitinispirillales bacterium]
MRISVVIPLYNEEKSLKELFESIKKIMTENEYEYEIIFVDDGSDDNSLSVIEEMAATNADTVKVISFGRNYGKSAALSVGFETAVGDYIVTIDADLQDDPSAIPELIKKIEQGFDLVSGWKKIRQDPVFTKNIPSKIFNITVSMMSGLKLHDFNCGLKIYKKETAKSLEIYGERHRFLPVLAYWNGYKISEYPVPHHKRLYGKSKFGLNRFFNGALDFATLLFLKKYMRNPMHFFGMISFFLIFLGFTILTYFGIIWIITFELHIRPLLLLGATCVIVGVQFFSIGLLGEMITNMNRERKYAIKKTAGFNKL